MIRIRGLHTADVDEVLAIADSQLGEKYITKADLSVGKVFVAEEDKLEKIVGFCIAYTDSNDGRSYVRTVAVNPAFSGRGIGTALVARAVEHLKNIGAKKILSPLWKHDDVINSDVIFRRNGFAPKYEIRDYWLEDSKKRGFSCPICGNECHCTCVMYELAET